jgi:hypothetical protein
MAKYYELLYGKRGSSETTKEFLDAQEKRNIDEMTDAIFKRFNNNGVVQCIRDAAYSRNMNRECMLAAMVWYLGVEFEVAQEQLHDKIMRSVEPIII